jgi:hypothetical protein
MKKLLVILGLSFFTTTVCFSQAGDNDNDKIREKMSEFIQRRMGLSRAEAERFNPVFMRYFREWKTTIRTNLNDKPMLQLRIAELRIRYRSEFRDIVGEKRCNQIYDHQEVFMRELKQLRQDQLQRRPIRRTKFMVN